MNGRISSVALLSILVICLPATAADKDKEEEKGFVSIFNGKDLTGWEGKPGGWTVERGALTAESTVEKPCKKAHYLFWRGGRPADFELRLSYRITGGNSGIQFRSREVPDWDTSGYQADLEAGQQWTGALFEHTRGGIAMRGTKVLIDPDGKKQVTKIADPAKLLKRVKAGDWNEYHVIARGSHITLKINGVVMSEAIDNDRKHAARRGHLALQMHPGPPMKVQFKNLRLKIYK